MSNANNDVEFQAFETKIDEVMEILKMMNSGNTDQQKTACNLADEFLGTDTKYQQKLKQDDFIVSIRNDRTVINKSIDTENEPMEEDGNSNSSMGKTAFMASVERDAARRTKERKERECVAQNLRKLGNQAFHSDEYEKAINLYTKSLDQVKDNYVVYNNRALTYIRMGLYKRAIIDCDFVIQKLDEKNLRSWLYRASAYYALGETRDFDKSINEAKKNNPKELEYIEEVVEFIKNSKNMEQKNVMTVELEK